MLLGRELPLFRRTKALEREIDEFLDKVAEGALTVRIAIKIYMTDGPGEPFEAKLHHVHALESDADALRRSIETKLYAQTLIPESRGDVLGLLETMDTVLNQMEGVLWGFSIETPEIPESSRDGYVSLTEMVALSVEALVHAARAFFRDIGAVGNNSHKVMFYEKEADEISTNLKRSIFMSSLPLANKIHLRYFVESIDNIADRAEDVADRLAIYTLKRTV